MKHPSNTSTKKYLGIILAIVSLSTFIGTAYAENYTSSIFANSIKVANSNAYTDSKGHFSINPPLNWVVLKNLPAEVSNNASVIFSNNDKSELATFGIYHRTLPQGSIDTISQYSDSDILNQIGREMSADTTDYKTTVLNAVIDRYKDGIRIITISSTNYSTDNTTSYSANMIYFLNSGDEYTLVLTSSEDYFDQNAHLFKESTDTFYANNPSITSTNIVIPSWVKNDAKWWSGGTLTDSDFVKAIQYLIDNKVIVVPQNHTGVLPSPKIPSWIKNDAKWWSDGSIDDSEFVKGLEYMINNGILTV